MTFRNSRAYKTVGEVVEVGTPFGWINAFVVSPFSLPIKRAVTTTTQRSPFIHHGQSKTPRMPEAMGSTMIYTYCFSYT